MTSKQPLQIQNAHYMEVSDQSNESSSESFICLYNPDAVITSPDIMVSSIRKTEVTNTIIGHFKPEISSIDTFRIEYEAPLPMKVEVCLNCHNCNIVAPLTSARLTTVSIKRKRGVMHSTGPRCSRRTQS